MVPYSALGRRRRNFSFYLTIYVFIFLSAFIWWIYTVLKASNPARIAANIDPALPYDIFFVNTGELVQLTPREACALESAARANPNATIHYYITGMLRPKTGQLEEKFWNTLQGLSNVEMNFINITEFMAATPLVEINPKWVEWHRSELLRYALLWKYPGTFLNADIISRRPLSKLGSSWVAQQILGESHQGVSGGAFNFGSDEVGRMMINNIVADLAEKFIDEGSVIESITKVVEKQCKGKDFTVDTVQDCDGLRVWPANTFGIYYENRSALYEEIRFEEAMGLVHKSVGVHLFNYLTGEVNAYKNKRVLINELAKRYCPTVYSIVQSYL